ncbi:MAG: hypothetical protein LBC29_01660 [Propionibacteriaceae bacterium]|jgi:hypothetical protein|nr:hypothetical protein [Propionibacteriaceae bacterium]
MSSDEQYQPQGQRPEMELPAAQPNNEYGAPYQPQGQYPVSPQGQYPVSESAASQPNPGYGAPYQPSAAPYSLNPTPTPPSAAPYQMPAAPYPPSPNPYQMGGTASQGGAGAPYPVGAPYQVAPSPYQANPNPYYAGYPPQQPGGAPLALTFNVWAKTLMDESLRKGLRSVGVVTIICAVLTLGAGIMTENYFALIDVAILLGLGLGSWLAINRACAVILLAYSIINTIYIFAAVGTFGGWFVLLAGGIAVMETFKAHKAWDAYKAANGIVA